MSHPCPSNSQGDGCTSRRHRGRRGLLHEGEPPREVRPSYPPTFLPAYLPTCLLPTCLPAYCLPAYLYRCTRVRPPGATGRRRGRREASATATLRFPPSYLPTFTPSYLPTAPPRSDFTSTCRCVDRASTGGAMCACVQRCTFRVCCVGRVSSASNRQWSLKCHRVARSPTRNRTAQLPVPTRKGECRIRYPESGPPFRAHHTLGAPVFSQVIDYFP